jgi:spore maturation protein CgeB
VQFVYFSHSLVSDWNHGNAHFLRGVVRELLRRGHGVRVYEPADGWSRHNLLREAGAEALGAFARWFPGLASETYTEQSFDVATMLAGADVVIAHEWTDAWVIAALSRHRRGTGRYRLLFHDTHHRAISRPDELAGFDLDGFDGVLAFGEAIRAIYLQRGWSDRAWTWHEAADTALFHPLPQVAKTGDLVWVGNWGDDERTQDLQEFLLRPVRQLSLLALVHGVRYPPDALQALAASGARYGGWLPNHRVPEVFAQHRLTVHIPRRPYVGALPGIPTIRVFEALACGIPLISAPWDDCEGLFRVGVDFLMVRNGEEMAQRIRDLLADPAAAAALAESGLATILARHTCRHRVDELLQICGAGTAAAAAEGGERDFSGAAG